MDEAVFLTSALCFGMERTFVKRDVNTKNLLSAGNLSPAVKDLSTMAVPQSHAVISVDETMNL